MATAGWYGDPTRRGRMRYWDGGAWTERVSDAGTQSSEPIHGAQPGGAGDGGAPAATAGHPCRGLGTRRGVGVSALFALLLAFALIGFRTSEELIPAST
jgi:hypothetical protein